MDQNGFVYLDYAASAPMSEPALAAELAYEGSDIAGANPNSLHTLGRKAQQALEKTRRDLARCLGGGFRPSDVVYTSGGTESNNIALYGISEGARARDRKRTRVIISAIEHDSEIDVAPSLRGRGFDVEFVRPDRSGRVTAEALEPLLDDRVALVSVMSANNETGVVQPVAELCRAAHAHGALFHTDAVQAFGRIPLELDEVDAVSAAAHKIGGPVGIAVLAMRGRTPFRPQGFGGGQEQGRRAGTQNVRSALAFAAAALDVCENLSERRALVSARANRLYQTLCAEGTGILPTTSATIDEGRLPGMVSIMCPGVDSETLILKLDRAGFEVSAGSACSSGSLDPSHVLSAMGIPRDQALGALRISFDERIAEDDLDRFAQALLDIVRQQNGRL
ncbi:MULTISPECIES: cysteine desulfurase family protein [Atopobiaceae]|uniref:cysteine desulfurase n=1 Tax=Parafannyhessea umbonata TaxID=604330 RepID=A0A1H6JMU5_9ACTN|nr:MULTISPECIES: cysteine desulfurase family protein [Atopobiaceae]SEH60616.1 cysteine desulfurase [Parafannyhessea umbonata]SJZ81043.1 cysteine desulfurase [Olsenella sp. KH1P3]